VTGTWLDDETFLAFLSWPNFRCSGVASYTPSGFEGKAAEVFCQVSKGCSKDAPYIWAGVALVAASMRLQNLAEGRD
jgi:hypothetical protein